MRNVSILVVVLLVSACSKKEGEVGKDDPAVAQARQAKDEYVNKSKATEAMLGVKRIYDGARVYYLEEIVAPGAVAPAAHQFPASAKMTPPAGSCCKGDKGRCAPDPALWSDPAWSALSFSMDDPHYYSYEYLSTGTAFTARAVGDLDCDGTFSTFEIHGVIDPEGNVTGSYETKKINELE